MRSRKINLDDVEKFHDYGIFLPTRTLYMGSEHVDTESESGVDASMAERQVKNLHMLDSISNEDITIILNNVGGDTNHGLAIYDAIKSCKSNVIVKVFGNAASMGSVILQSADWRVMAKNAVQMIHYGQLGIERESKTAFKFIDECKRLNKWMEDMYLSRINQKYHMPITELRNMLERDTYLTAEESVKLGLADEILE